MMSSLVFAGVAPHPPIMVPEVGHDAIGEVRNSIDAMALLTERLRASGAETVIMISPHAPLQAEAFVAYDGPDLYGDFGSFRAPKTTVDASLDAELLNEITRAASAQRFDVTRIRGYDLDHGTTVPLYFLQRNGWTGRFIALGYSFLSNEDHIRFGKCVREAIDKIGRPVAFIASGDLSHRLRVDAPAGYYEHAHLFDEEIVDAIRQSSTRRIVEIDPELRRLAGECGYRSMLVALGAAEGLEPACEVISYEAPFGVGYLVAQLFAASQPISSDQSKEVRSSPPELNNQTSATIGSHPTGDDVLNITLPALARQVIETFVRSGEVIVPPDEPHVRAACFVSVKTLGGELRGCIGTIEPAKDSLGAELVANAISAATRDPRFFPIKKEELANLRYSVDVISPPEPTRIEDLDPNVYGVIVEDPQGIHRGLLLPGLEGVDTVAKQVQIASNKAGLKPGSEIRLWRFRAERYSELHSGLESQQ